LRKRRRGGDENPAHRAAPAAGLVRRIVPCAKRHLRLAGPGQVLQPVPFGVGHRAAELVQRQPGGLATSQARLSLALQRRAAAGMAGNDAGGGEPRLARQVAAMDDGPRRHRGLATAVGTLPRGADPVSAHLLPLPHRGTAEPVRPPTFDQIPRAGRIVGKERPEHLARHGTI